MISKLLIIIIIGLILYVLKNIASGKVKTYKAQDKKNDDVIDAEFKVVKDKDDSSR